MLLSDVPIVPGVPRPEFAFKVTGKAGGPIPTGSPAGSVDGKTYLVLTGDPTDIAGITVYDQRKVDAGFVLDDIIAVLVLGVISAKADGVIAAGARVTASVTAGKVTSSADPGVATVKNYLGVALTDAAADLDIIWLLVMPQRDSGT